MITILHGENEVQSRQKLVSLLDEARTKGIEIHRVQAKKISRADLEEQLIRTDLFGSEKLVVIEGLHSLPKGKAASELISLVATSLTNIVLWEARALTATMLKQFPGAEAYEFKISKKLFAWLDSLSGRPTSTQQVASLKLLHESLEQEDAMFCFIMLIRQVRLLIQVADGVVPPGAPFMITKLKKQVQSFTPPQLQKMHERLTEMDINQKTSGSAIDLATQLDLFLLNLYS